MEAAADRGKIATSQLYVALSYHGAIQCVVDQKIAPYQIPSRSFLTSLASLKFASTQPLVFHDIETQKLLSVAFSAAGCVRCPFLGHAVAIIFKRGFLDLRMLGVTMSLQKSRFGDG